jgi:hypothetical protein
MQDINKGFYPMRNEQHLQDGLFNLMDTLESLFGDISNWDIIEIGSYTGDSSKIFASRFKSVTCIDPFQNDYDPNDMACYFAPFDAVYDRFIENTKDVKNIELIRDYSDNALTGVLSNKKFDFVYIDGLHTYEQVKKDIENSLPLLNSNNGKMVIGGHDYSPTWQGVVNAINEKIGFPEHTFIDTSWIKILR